MQTASPAGHIVAVLGPTNTGKTHYAIERMLGHESGMMGFPLRLLARENYDRVVRLKGRHAVALITGEEKIVPPNARYFLCTVESMPLDRPVAFLAVDEVQLAADPERGHIFTERLLRARGTEETVFIGAETIRPVLRRIVPEAEVTTRPRLSRLSYAGTRKLSRLPPRSAVVAFSANDVYALAEQVRRQRGGTAVVMGALSPRTRNAQVELYQSGDVDYLVATDAIGMGLNMDVNHVAFAGLSKYDGHQVRALADPELAQIAGRAGRHMNDGTFGTTAGMGALAPETIEAIEAHEFVPLKSVVWRNAALDFSDPRALLRSLRRAPPDRHFARAREAEDVQALAVLSRNTRILELAKGPAAVRLLWDVCQVPDFRKILSDHHARLLGRIYRFLMAEAGRLPPDWVANQIAQLDRTDGDIDTLMARIAGTRTWTYLSHRSDWIDDAAGWQERTRAIEDRLSDALHDRLTDRFVDRRAATLVRRKGEASDLIGAVNRAGDVMVEGQYVGRLDGFRFEPDAAESAEDRRAIWSAARQALREAIVRRVARFEDEAAGTVALGPDGTLRWRGAPVGRLAAGRHPLEPAVRALPSDLLDPALAARVEARLATWVEGHLRKALGPLFTAREAELAGPPRGIVYQLGEALGALPRPVLADLINDLKPSDRKALGALGVRLGQATVYYPALLKPRAVLLRGLLWAVHSGEAQAPIEGAPASLAVDSAEPAGLYAASGYRIHGGAAFRADVLEKLAGEARKRTRQGPFAPTPPLRKIVGGDDARLAAALALLGFRAHDDDVAGLSFSPERPRRRKGKSGGGRPRDGKPGRPAPGSPFAVLHELVAPK